MAGQPVYKICETLPVHADTATRTRGELAASRCTKVSVVTRAALAMVYGSAPQEYVGISS
jgi:hypothetical protein